MSKDEIERIKTDIVKSGLPCEIDISIKLRFAGWEVMHQDEYIDEDTEKSRYIDICAFKNFPDGLPQTNLTIECCKGEKPWVFYGGWKRWGWPTVVPNYLPQKADVIKREPEFLECTHHKRKEILEATISYEPFKKGKGVEIFDAAMKAIKALRYSKSRLRKFDQKQTKKETPRLERIFYPVIAFDGHLYSLYFRKGKPYPKKREYLRYLVNFKERGYLIDVVTRMGFSEYLMLLEKEFRCLRQYRQNKKS